MEEFCPAIDKMAPITDIQGRSVGDQCPTGQDPTNGLQRHRFAPGVCDQPSLSPTSPKAPPRVVPHINLQLHGQSASFQRRVVQNFVGPTSTPTSPTIEVLATLNGGASGGALSEPVEDSRGFPEICREDFLGLPASTPGGTPLRKTLPPSYMCWEGFEGRPRTTTPLASTPPGGGLEPLAPSGMASAMISTKNNTNMSPAPLGGLLSSLSNGVSEGGSHLSSLLIDNKLPSFLTVPQVTVLDSRNPAQKILREPRSIYGVLKELAVIPCSPRWPYECQVLPHPIKHIKSVPSVPELFYEPSGKEPQPRPLGEEHGTLCYEYLPTSSVNYFSRSVPGPSPNGQTDPAATPCDLKTDHISQLPDTLRFESRFESGNLAKVNRITETYYELYLRPDFYTSKHCQWFYFQVKNMKSDVTYRFSIINFSKPDSLYNYGMKPVLYSTIEAERHYVGWSRVGSNIRYYRNDVYDEEEGYSYTLTFTLTFPHDDDTVYLAHCYPYTYTDLHEDLCAIQNNENRAQYCSQRLLCRTLAGNNVYILTITSPSTQEDLRRKSFVVLSARVHPGETPSSWIMRGVLHFLTGDSEIAAELRDRFIFKIVPMLNPDGVVIGNTRCSLAGRDLNRQYKSVIKEAFPPVFHIKSLVRRLMEEGGVVFYCDFHAHSRKFNIFIYGCENRRHSEKYLKEQVFPLMLHKNSSEKFSFEDCRFHIQRQKETTGRVVFWNMGITCSYTLEASYGGTNMGSRAFTHFNTDDYEGIGRYFCETLQDFYDPCPVNEQLRAKILGRLTKEGSTANEPANIALSDYSSLSSGGEDDEAEAAADTNNNSDGDEDNDEDEDDEGRANEVSDSNGDSNLANSLTDIGQIFSNNHKKSEHKRGSRRTRSRRLRMKGLSSYVGSGVGQFHSTGSHQQQGFYNYSKADGFYGSVVLATMIRKSDSEKVLNGKGSNNAGGHQSDQGSSAGNQSPGTPKKASKKHKRKFKRSLTMTSLPVAMLKDMESPPLSAGPVNASKGFATDSWSLESSPSQQKSKKGSAKAKGSKKGNLVTAAYGGSGATGSTCSKNATKFTIGTSDESDDCQEALEDGHDLERLFFPRTDSQGSPLYDPVDAAAAAADGEPPAVSHLMTTGGGCFGEQLSAVSCRRVHSEILESVSKIKCSLLGRKGGLLHSYGHYGSEAALNDVGGSNGDGDSDTHSLRASSSYGGIKSGKKAIQQQQHQGGTTTLITVSIPSPAGNRKSGSCKDRSSSSTRSSKGGGRGSSSKDKCAKIRKAVRHLDRSASVSGAGLGTRWADHVGATKQATAVDSSGGGAQQLLLKQSAASTARQLSSSTSLICPPVVKAKKKKKPKALTTALLFPAAGPQYSNPTSPTATRSAAANQSSIPTNYGKSCQQQGGR